WSALRDIACFTPPLAPESQPEREETAVELQAMLEGLNKSWLSQISARLSTALKADVVMTGNLSSLSQGGSGGLLSCMALEAMRAEFGPIASSLAYLDPEITDEAHHKVVSRMTERTCEMRCRAHLNGTARFCQDSNLSRWRCTLWVLNVLATGSPPAKHMGQELITHMIVERFPQTPWSQPCMMTMLRLMKEVEEEAKPENMMTQLSAVNVLRRVQSTWLSKIVESAPSAAKALIETHLLPIQKGSSGPGHDSGPHSGVGHQLTGGLDAGAIGWAANALLNTLVNISEPPALASKDKELGKDSTQDAVTREATLLTLKAHYYGGLNALQSLCNADVYAVVADSRRNIIKDLASCVNMADGAPPEKTCDLGNALFCAVTLMQTSSEPDAELLRLLCWCPAYKLTRVDLRNASFSWNWLLSSQPHLTNNLLSGAVAPLEDDLTGVTGAAQSPHLCPKMVAEDPYVSTVGRGVYKRGGEASVVQGILAHCTWITFLLDRWQVVQTFN
ncbi:hypothetical protein CYMTET_36801, partial [Cymbomonas tetramitiformis]